MNAFSRLLRLYAARVVLILTVVFAALHTQNAFALGNCGLVSLTVPAGPTGCDVQFGVSTQYDGGYETSIAMNSAGLVVETHRASDNNIWYTVGKINAISGLTIDWGTPQKTGMSGYWPAVALGENGWVYLMYSNAATRALSKQYYRVGTLDLKGNQGQLISWRSNPGYIVSGDGGFHASLSVMGTLLVGAYETGGGNDTCSYAIGTPNNPDHGDFSIHWYTGAGDKRTISGSTCNNPHIAVAPGGKYGEGQILLVYDRNASQSRNIIVYERGSIQNAGNNEKQMDWEAGPTVVTTDEWPERPAIALLPNGFVMELHEFNDELRSTVGKMDLGNPSASIDWASSETFDLSGRGTYPALTSNGTVAVQTHERSLGSVPYPDLYYSVSSVRDRNNWMGDLASPIRSKTLQNIVIPGSHNSGMYSDQGGCNLGQSQDQDLYQQLQGGVRYFDLKVEAGAPQLIYDDLENVSCDPVNTVMEGVAKFMGENHKEVVVLKFSHLLNFNCSQYQTLRNTITSNFPNLYTGDGRPAEQSLNSLGGKVVVVVSNSDDFSASGCGPFKGFYVSADATGNATNAALGQFNVYDSYANTDDYDVMVADQKQKFASYNGKLGSANIPSDLFLLSWTLTPTSNPNLGTVSLDADRNLSSGMTNWFPNSGGFIPNILYVDYYERARVTDNAVIMTQRFNPQP